MRTYFTKAIFSPTILATKREEKMKTLKKIMHKDPADEFNEYTTKTFVFKSKFVKGKNLQFGLTPKINITKYYTC